MVTKYWRVDPDKGSGRGGELTEAAALLRSGDTVAFPTETVYGLGADATNTSAVERIFSAKGRPSDNPLIVHIADTRQLTGLIEPACVTPDHRRLMEAFWPGPLTIVLPVKPGGISPLVTAGLTTVGIRIPDHPVALQLLREAELPIAAPSANRSGRPSPTLASHVREDLDGRIGGIVDGGGTGVGVESTVIQLVHGQLYILRPGGVTAEQLQSALPAIRIHEPEREDVQASETPRAPGMKYTHYAPKGYMHIVFGDDTDAVAAWIQRDIHAAKSRGESTGILTFEERASRFEADLVIACGSLAEPETIAQELYAALRQFDLQDIHYIVAEGCPETGIGQAIMNRLRKAAGHRLVRV
ncbi:L-threonylcarbamoyladenylate synthase [Paenibacillus planticolens]|uniref:Threonylcarbamoyl-AMP synthase n=1 Tax=Paenibacillus planticolens TaxID=2654976 RepID=A0ABX1ZWL7_9BACL|nr:L-threonylcarbamoyladenylate synthase [Paenibacillus planticolens]NOV04441.1 threonylcarbamoyl-AMP synthase [Paenibacillus planticolens]